MRCKNYYTCAPEELTASIFAIRSWLLNFQSHKEYQRVEFALEVALCAKELKRDPFVDGVIDTLC